MNTWFTFISHSIQNSHFTALFFDAFLKSLIVLALAGGVCALWHRSSAATRHLIWFLAVVSLPFLPLFSSVLPSWQRPLWSVTTSLNSGNQVSLTLEFVPVAKSGTFPQLTSASPDVAGTSNADLRQSGGSRQIATQFSASWLATAFIAWFGGMVLLIIYGVLGQLRLGKISRMARPLRSNDWALVLQEACEALRLRRAVLLLQSADNVMPMTWGWWRPVVLLPTEAEQWPADRRRIVLLHELSHVKRWDCLTQLIANVVCALFWFNPLAWVAARRMCVERERACDDLVLNGGCKASDYASHLLEIAESFRRIPQVAAIAMARPSGLEQRVAAIVDASRNRRLRSATVLTILAVVGGITLGLGGSRTNDTSGGTDESNLFKQQIARLQTFSVAKEKQAHALATGAGEEFYAGFQPFFNAATNGDWRTVTNIFADFHRRHPQYENSSNNIPHVVHWQTVLEIWLAYVHVGNCEPKYTQIAVDGIINSIPAGGIYFGGTDPGRGLPTAFCKSQIDADPFFTLTQNALADGTYLKYLRLMYGGKIYIPTDEDSQRCFQEYMQDAQTRLQNHQLKPGEDLSKDSNGVVQVKGEVAVMMINGLLAKVVFDKNPDREFFVEESFPLDWMYPYLEPHGLIMKINRQPLPELSGEIVQRDHDYWTKCVSPMIGDWLSYDTSVSQVTAFVEKVQLKQNFTGFKGDPLFIQNDYARKMFSKLRTSIAGVYVWRMEHAASESEKARMGHEADFAFRQAFALCPYSVEAVYRYVNFLLVQKRGDDALLVAETAAKMPSMQGNDGSNLRDTMVLLKKSKEAKQTSSGGKK